MSDKEQFTDEQRKAIAIFEREAALKQEAAASEKEAGAKFDKVSFIIISMIILFVLSILIDLFMTFHNNTRVMDANAIENNSFPVYIQVVEIIQIVISIISILCISVYFMFLLPYTSTKNPILIHTRVSYFKSEFRDKIFLGVFFLYSSLSLATYSIKADCYSRNVCKIN